MILVGGPRALTSDQRQPGVPKNGVLQAPMPIFDLVRERSQPAKDRPSFTNEIVLNFAMSKLEWNRYKKKNQILSISWSHTCSTQSYHEKIFFSVHFPQQEIYFIPT